MLNRFSLTPRAIPFKISVALVLLSGALFAGIAAQVVGNGALVHLDLAIYQQLRAYNYSPVDDALEVISLLGSELIFMITLPLAGYLIWQRHWRAAIVLLLAVGGGEAIVLLLKPTFALKPLGKSVAFIPLNRYRFPSGHATEAFIFYGLISYSMIRGTGYWRWRALAGGAAAALALLIGFSQLIVGGHYLSDVLGGYAVGLMWLVITITVGAKAHRGCPEGRSPSGHPTSN
jgi:membrane-associated phospholipid phosphatase